MADNAARKSSDARRSSGTFSNLMAQKRNSTDESITARRLSHSEMNTKPGFLGSMWNSFVKPGHASNSVTESNTAANANFKKAPHRSGAKDMGFN